MPKKKFKIGIDDGHGPHTKGKETPYIRRLGRRIKENEFNKPVSLLLQKKLEAHGFDVVQLAPTDYDTPLATRTYVANREECDIVISIHFNAMGNTFGASKARGFSVHIQPALKANTKSAAYKLASLIIEELAKGTPQVNRGIVGQNLHMTRETKMPAVLVECGFMDDEEEAELMLKGSFHEEVASELYRATCRYFDEVPKKNAPTASTPVTKPKPSNKVEYYRVRKTWANVGSQKGAFTEPAGAKKLADALKNEGYKVYNPKGQLYYEPKKAMLKPKYEIPNKTVKYGDSGADVTLLQRALNAAYFKLVKGVDGHFGPDTLQALKRFQSVYTPHEVDGIAGPNTRRALASVLNG